MVISTPEPFRASCTVLTKHAREGVDQANFLVNTTFVVGVVIDVPTKSSRFTDH